ncbi:hypothetical protein E3J48_04225 [Candidatus Aerophobetes bacterium]|uniref:Uncharacterized protein n=1 Tax=Aerophobetes bacterium TaxID=2030807 RepID=A0A523W5V7_UNCAE|nr:MAG: hypothetical protein E3J48_04225 [Candidatus Aerophobetes bacterium]
MKSRYVIFKQSEVTRLTRDYTKGEFRTLSFEEFGRLVDEVLRDSMLVTRRWNTDRDEIVAAAEQELMGKKTVISF